MFICNIFFYNFRNEVDDEGYLGFIFIICIILYKLNGIFDLILLDVLFVES